MPIVFVSCFVNSFCLTKLSRVREKKRGETYFVWRKSSPLESARLLKFLSAELSFCTSSAQDFYPLKVWNFFQSDRAQRRYSVRPRRRGIYFDAFRRSVHMHQYAEGFDRKRIDLKTLLKMDQNVNAYISY